MTKKTWKLGAVAVALSAMAATSTVANAAPFYETVDAGDLFSTGQAVSSGTSQIFGTLSGTADVDMFTFYWPGVLGGATTFQLVVGGVTDTQLFLVNSAGTLLAANDDIDTPGGNYASLIFPILAAGTYGLAISAFDNDPTTGIGSTLTAWTGAGSEAVIGSGAYQITVLGDGNISSPVPEPETYAMLLAGLGLMGFVARRRKLKLATA